MSDRDRRKSREIRKSLAETRRVLDHDLEELEDRVEESLSPRQFLARHPAIITLAGAVLGVLVVRKPALLARLATRVAQAGAPFLVKALLERDTSSEEKGGVDEEPSTDEP